MKNAKLSSIRLLAVSLFAFCSLSFSAAQAQNRHVLVINETSLTLTRFFASNIAQPGWQEDMLGLGVLGPGRYVDANIDDGSGYCHFDLKAVFSDGEEVIRYNVDVCSITSWTIHE